MARRPTKRLNHAAIPSMTKPGRHADGEGLYLVIDRNGARRWAFLFRWDGKLKEMGLGGCSKVSLAMARKAAAEAREHLGARINPIAARRAIREVPTFGQMADEMIAIVAKESRNAKHLAGWKLTLGTHAAPLRAKKVNEIGTDDVLAVLKPLAETRQETASRLRGRIERVLDAARAKGFRSGENPARWDGHLAHHLPKRRKDARGHHAAMPYAGVPSFVAELAERSATTSLALEFLILNAARSNEVLGARWDEIDIGAKVWTVPANRMKAGREHRVPLSSRAVAILEKAAARRTGTYVFPGSAKGADKDRPLSTNALRALLIRAAHADVTPHGFRSSFRTWAGDASTFPREIAEAALAHVIGDAAEQSYNRGDALERRRALMDTWAAFITN